jgi:hypothetical protein
MKSLINTIKVAIFAIITITTTTSCSNVGGTRISNNSTRARAGVSYKTEYKTVSETVAPSATVGLEVYGNQPSDPTPAAKANKVTWGSTHGGQAYNEMRPKAYARLESPDNETMILLDTTTGFMWKVGCYNRIVPAQSRTIERQVAIQVPVPVQVEEETGGGDVRVDNSIHVETGLNNLLAGAFDLAGQVVERGLVYEPIPGRCYQQQQRRGYCPQPRMQRPPQQQVYCPQPQNTVINRKFIRVHNYNETRNLNVNNAPRSYRY